MRLAIRFLAILTIAALLAPGVRWASLRGPVEACACPPVACMCPRHHHAFGHTPICIMANGGQCGVDSHDSYLSSLLSTLIYVPTEHHWWNPVCAVELRSQHLKLKPFAISCTNSRATSALDSLIHPRYPTCTRALRCKLTSETGRDRLNLLRFLACLQPALKFYSSARCI